jgi:hypothetical protein
MGPDLGALLAATGCAPVRVTPVTGLPSRVLKRGSFRIDLADGRVLKGRRFDQPSHAEGFERLAGLSRLEGLPRVLARQGSATLEEWVPGTPLSEAPLSPALLRACGAVLGRLHALPAPPSEAAAAPDVHVRRAALESQLGELERLSLVPSRLARRVRRLVGAEAPASATVGFIHRDFCPENLVLGPGGRPVAVDNTTLAIDCHDFDLGRTWYRWPMTEAQWAPFTEGYRDHRDPGPFVAHRRFWATAALVEAALFRHRAGTPRAGVPIERLHALVSPTRSRGIRSSAWVRPPAP